MCKCRTPKVCRLPKWLSLWVQITRLIRQYTQSGQIQVQSYRRHRFPRCYGEADLALLAEVDRAGRHLGFPPLQPAAERRLPPAGRPLRADAAHPDLDRRTATTRTQRPAGLLAGGHRASGRLGRGQGGRSPPCRRRRNPCSFATVVVDATGHAEADLPAPGVSAPRLPLSIAVIILCQKRGRISESFLDWKMLYIARMEPALLGALAAKSPWLERSIDLARSSAVFPARRPATTCFHMSSR